MDFTEITTAVENLDKTEWANLNLFIPRLFTIADTNKAIVSALTYAHEPSNKNFADLGNYNIKNWAQLKPLLKSIKKVNFGPIPLKKENDLLVVDANMRRNSTVDLVFHLDKPMAAMELYKDWRHKLYTEELKYSNSFTFKRSLVVPPSKTGSDESAKIAEGTLLCTYVELERNPTSGVDLKGRGELFITGLIPTNISAPTEYGPGLNAQSSAAEITITCVYSLGYLQIGTTQKGESVINGERLWLA